jgi:hypothetical protein
MSRGFSFGGAELLFLRLWIFPEFELYRRYVVARRRGRYYLIGDCL